MHLEYVVILFLVVAAIFLAAAIAILFPLLRQEREADAASGAFCTPALGKVRRRNQRKRGEHSPAPQEVAERIEKSPVQQSQGQM